MMFSFIGEIVVLVILMSLLVFLFWCGGVRLRLNVVGLLRVVLVLKFGMVMKLILMSGLFFINFML